MNARRRSTKSRPIGASSVFPDGSHKMRIRYLTNSLTLACCGVAVSVASGSAQGSNERTLLLVEIKCPVDNKDMLESIRRNALGERQEFTVEYKNGKASHVIISKVQPKSEPDRWFGWNFLTNDFLTQEDAQKNPDSRKGSETIADIFRDRADRELRRYCLSGPDERKKALDEIVANRKKLGLD